MKFLKNKLSYVITIIISLFVGISGTLLLIYYIPEKERVVEVEKIIEIPKEIIKKVKKPRKKKEKVIKEEPAVEEIISESVQTKPEVEQNASLKNSKKSTTSFTQKTGFYK